MWSMSGETQLQDITRTIQLAVAPVFLLSAIGTTCRCWRCGWAAWSIARAASRPSSRASPVPCALPRFVELRQLERSCAAGELGADLGGRGRACWSACLIGVAFVGYLISANFGRRWPRCSFSR